MLRTRPLPLLLVVLLPFAAAQPVQPEPEPTPSELMRTLTIPEANQGIAVDAEHFYAVDNQTIAKYNKRTGERVDMWEGAEGGPIIHLDSGSSAGWASLRVALQLLGAAHDQLGRGLGR